MSITSLGHQVVEGKKEIRLVMNEGVFWDILPFPNFFRILVIGVNDDGSLIHLINNEELRHALKLTEGHNQDFVLFDGKVAGAGKRFTTVRDSALCVYDSGIKVT